MVGLVMFFLQYGLPSVWQTKPDAGVTANTNLGSGQMAIVLLALLGYAFLSLRLEIGIFVREMRNEWLLPAFLGLAFVSTTWSADPNFTFSISVALFVVLLLGYWMATRFTVATLLGVLGWVFAAGSTVSVVMINVFPDYAISAQGWTGLLKNRNLFGQSCVLAVVVFLFCARIHRRWRVPAYAFAGMNVWFVIGSESKTSLVAVIAMPIMMLTFVVFHTPSGPAGYWCCAPARAPPSSAASARKRHCWAMRCAAGVPKQAPKTAEISAKSSPMRASRCSSTRCWRAVASSADSFRSASRRVSVPG